MTLQDLFESFTTSPPTDVERVQVRHYLTVPSCDSEPVTIIDPAINGPWICGGAAIAWYRGDGVGLADIDVFCADAEQAKAVHDRLIKFGATRVHTSKNASSYTYCGQAKGTEWKIQLIEREFYSSLEDVIQAFDITACAIGTDGVQFLYGDNTLHDINNYVLRMTSPLRAGAVKRYCKYVAYGYRPVPGLHAAIFEDTDTTWEFEHSDDYDDL